MGHLLLVLGGQKSGKTSYAAARAAATGAPVVVVAPATVRDEELAARVARHRADRPATWQTLETFDLPAALRRAGDRAAVIVDALDTWLVETLPQVGLEPDADPTPDRLAAAEEGLAARLDAVCEAAAARAGLTAVIAGQPGLGMHGPTRWARAYVDLHGQPVGRRAVTSGGDGHGPQRRAEADRRPPGVR